MGFLAMLDVWWTKTGSVAVLKGCKVGELDVMGRWGHLFNIHFLEPMTKLGAGEAGDACLVHGYECSRAGVGLTT